MRKPKCILVKLLNTPGNVRVRIVKMQCEEIPTFCVCKRAGNVLGWEVVDNYAEHEEAIGFVSTFFDKLILYK